MKKTLPILILAFSLTSCTVIGTFYLINESNSTLTIQINLKNNYQYDFKKDLIKIAEKSDQKIKYGTYKKMNKRQISLDTLTNQFSFKLAPNEFAYLGNGSNTKFRKVKNILIYHEKDTLKFDGNRNGDFKIARRALAKFVGIRHIK